MEARKPRTLFLRGSYDSIYQHDTAGTAQIRALCDVYAPPLDWKDEASRALLKDCEVLFSGWYDPKMDEEFLRYAPNLKLILYGAGSIKSTITPAVFERGIRVCSAWRANAVPVAQYTAAQVVLLLKNAYRHIAVCQTLRTFPRKEHRPPTRGVFGATVGLVSLGAIGRLAATLLQDYDVTVLAYDPFADAEAEARRGVTLCSLEEIFQKSDVVSLHTPLLPQTTGLVNYRLLSMMKQGASLLNTARGKIVVTEDLCRILQQRPDLFALLDVTDPEPPAADSPLWDMENVVLTPHIAGSLGNEYFRMVQYMLSDCRRYLAGQPLENEITESMVATMA